MNVVLNRSQVRSVDQRAIDELGMHSLVLMENAGRGAVDLIQAADLPEPYLIACGKGNNGGDGLVIARHMALRGMAVRVLIWNEADQFSTDAATNYDILRHCQLPIDHLASDPCGDQFAQAVSSAGTIIDALLGTGATGDPRSPYDRVIDGLNQSTAKRVAIDIPSGLDCDTGDRGSPTFQADLTITFVAPKPGLLVGEAASHVGELKVTDIGVPPSLIEAIAGHDAQPPS